MLLRISLLIAVATLATPIALSEAPKASGETKSATAAEMIALPAATFSYRLPGEFTSEGRAVDAPTKPATIFPISIMKRQVTAGEYTRCVTALACSALPADALSWPDRPAVKVSWRDAESYAAWLSKTTGQTYRLPSDEEWVFAAASRFSDDALPVPASQDPSKRWLARYEQEAGRETRVEHGPQPVGTFGANENGILDLAGNIWEWTSTCYRRTALDTGDVTINCGVRVVEGQHRSYMTDFIRDPRGGGCAVGKPPDNLGFRLVREEARWPALRLWLQRLIS